MMSDDRYRWRDEWVWLRPFHLIGVVILLSILPYIDRSTARSLGAWMLIAPALAFFILGFGLLRLVKADNNSGSAKNAATLFLFAFLLATAANCWVVATVWIVAETNVAVPEMKTSDLADAVQATDVKTFASAAAGGLA